MGKYTLVGLDRDEKSIVHRALYEQSRVGEQAIKEIFNQMQRQHSLSNVRLIKPRWETSVHPLYFWAYKECNCEPGKSGNFRACFDYVLKRLPKPLRDELRAPFWYTVVDCEIDILIEDTEFFLFLETKIPVRGIEIDWYKSKHGVHQLVHQYVQGKILQKLLVPEKEFAVGTIGASTAEAHYIELSDIERGLLDLVDYEGRSLTIPAFPLRVLTG